MERYIDADKFVKSLEKQSYYSKTNIETRISKMPTADVQPVIHAHWNEFSDYTGTCYAECSRCGLLWWIEEGTAEENEMFYCPKCGAKMDEKEGKK